MFAPATGRNSKAAPSEGMRFAGQLVRLRSATARASCARVGPATTTTSTASSRASPRADSRSSRPSRVRSCRRSRHLGPHRSASRDAPRQRRDQAATTPSRSPSDTRRWGTRDSASTSRSTARSTCKPPGSSGTFAARALHESGRADPALGFVERGYALVHGACLVDGDDAYLITARTDTGKTTTMLKLLDSLPYEFVSDDLTLVSPDGTVLPYPKPLTISSHTAACREAAQLNWFERAHARRCRAACTRARVADSRSS